MHEFLVRLGGTWVRSQEQHFHARGRGLTPEELEALQRFHQEATLAAVRIYRLDRAEHFDWSLFPARLGPVIPFDWSRMIGITFGHTVVTSPAAPSSGPNWLRLLFHELVHVVQYDLIGVDDFVNRYVSGWVGAGFHYTDIPLEQGARVLDARFVADPTRGFSVRDEVKRQLANAECGVQNAE
jgi:hypothetical protein